VTDDCVAVCNKPHRHGNSRALRDHTVLPAMHPVQVTSPPWPQPIKAGAPFIHPGGMQSWVDLVGWVAYQDGISTHPSTNTVQYTKYL